MILKDNKTFCILPWVHTYIHTNGDIYPCCISWSSDNKAKLNNIRSDSLENAFNSDFMKNLRLDMLKGISRPDVCSTCYKSEAAGFSSLRTGKNIQYQPKVEAITQQMKSDGFVEPVISSIDYRFSNLCNLKCRTCGPEFSSAWAKEVGQAQNFINLKSEISNEILKNQYKNIEKIYFAGGEPLLMPEHFNTLKILIDSKQAEKVTLFYNSNVSNLHYQNYDLLNLWKHFNKVTIGASIDAVGERANYIRHGVKWSVIEKNLYTLMDYRAQQDNFNFYYNPTISIFNADHISDMHRYLWDNKLLPDINAIKFNLIVESEKYACCNLPEKIKDSISEKIDNMNNWLRDHDAEESIILQYQNLQFFLKQISSQSLLKEFLNTSNILDKKRNEDFLQTFPEYKELFINWPL